MVVVEEDAKEAVEASAATEEDKMAVVVAATMEVMAEAKDHQEMGTEKLLDRQVKELKV